MKTLMKNQNGFLPLLILLLMVIIVVVVIAFLHVVRSSTR